MPDITPQGLEHWNRRRSHLRRLWWIYLFISILGGLVFVRNFPPRDPYTFAILLLIPLIALRQAWKTDRKIAQCDQLLRDQRLRAPIIESKENT